MKVIEDGILVYKCRFLTIFHLFSETRRVTCGNAGKLTSYKTNLDALTLRNVKMSNIYCFKKRFSVVQSTFKEVSLV